MTQKDHLALAHYLLERAPEQFHSRLRRKAFLLGNFIPDYLFFTYLRGFRKSGKMIGHNLPYSEGRMRKLTDRLLETGIRNARDCFRLGLLMHYLADSFTFPHTERFRGTKAEHNRYEKALCSVFQEMIRKKRNAAHRLSEPVASHDLILSERQIYQSEIPSVEIDALWIIRVCEKVFDAVCTVKGA